MRAKAAVLAGVLTCMGVGAAGATPPKAPGTPGSPNCHGKTISYFAQLGKQDGTQRERGIGQLARTSFITPKDVQTVSYEVCAGE